MKAKKSDVWSVEMWSIWRDFSAGDKTWRVKTPVGVLAFKTRKAAFMAKAMYDQSGTTFGTPAFARKVAR